jgi:predicted nucleic acid-binding protein
LTFFVDVNVLIYAASPESPQHLPSRELLERVASRAAAARISTAVLEELWHLELANRTPALGGLTRRAYALFTPLLDVTDDAFRLALALDAPRLGANDRLHAGTCLAYGIDAIVTADAGFDDVAGIRRIDPLDEQALAGILRSSR